MTPIDSHYSNCDDKLSHIFRPFIDKLGREFEEEYFRNPAYMYAANLHINGMVFKGRYPAKVLFVNGIKAVTEIISIDDPKAKYFFDSHTEIIQLWEKLSKYRKMMIFYDMENMFLKLTEFKDSVNLPIQSLRWALGIEEEFNIFKAQKLLEGF